ncbi:integrin alpha-6 isoform 1-T1 [Synchiropus picturatus]
MLPRERPRHAATAALFYLMGSSAVLAFNLDTLQVLRRSGEAGSLFGFSLAMHRQLNPDRRLLLIGAPRAPALARQASGVTGGLYKCDISQMSDCERVDFDNNEDKSFENKENQWMGVTVQSQGPGGKVVTCAHRYQKRHFANTPQESRDITGRCYVLSQDLTIDALSDEDGGNWNFCEGRARGHEMFGSCQQGLAATFTKDYHYLVFGAPGAYNWKGVVRVEQKNNTLLEMGIYDDGPYEVGDLLNPDLVPVPANSYLGFSLDSGHSITRGRGLTVVAGAPRANHRGAVLLLRKENSDSTRLLVEHTLHGPGLASSFGYDVTVVDLNGDGWQDIVVGAPQFYMKHKDVEGAVYVYINQAGRWNRVSPVRLDGTKGSMFGLAVENIGDMNQDSYADLAVGAPSDDGGAGRVYIYHGSAKEFKTIPAQVISGKDHDIKLFGYSIAGNLDLDGNSYPDLAVGSLSDTVVIYRARPVISIRRVVKVSPKEIDLTVHNCGDSNCLAVDACFSYTGNPASYNPRITISYSVEADGGRRKLGLPSRVMFLNKSLSDTDFLFNGTLELRGQRQETCIKVKAKLKSNIKDMLRSIPIHVSAEIAGIKRHKTKNVLPPLMPILDPTQLSKESTEVNFVKEGCGSDHVCHSNLRMSYKLLYKLSKQDVYSPLPLENNVPVFHLNYERKDLALQLTVNNMNADDAYEAKLVGSFPDTLSYSGVRSHHSAAEKLVICSVNQNGSQAECELGNPFKGDSEVTFFIILSTDGLNVDTTEIDLSLQLQTTSVQAQMAEVTVKAKVVVELPLSVIGEVNPNRVSFGGVVKGESAMKTEEEIGSLVNYTFTINNLWKTLTPSVKASLHIHWPKWNKDGKWFLYLLKITTNGGKDLPCSPDSEVNPLRHIQLSSTSKTKREAAEVKHVGRQSDKNKLFKCGKEMKCVVLKCPLQAVDGTTIELRSRLWNSTFIEDYASLSFLDVMVKASLVLHTSKNMILATPDSNVRLTVFPESTVAQYGGVLWWIILVAVLAGIFILGLLVFLLWKCGFFKRSKQEDKVPQYHAVRIRRETPPYEDGKMKSDPCEKKPWMTWVDSESYS